MRAPERGALQGHYLAHWVLGCWECMGLRVVLRLGAFRRGWRPADAV